MRRNNQENPTPKNLELTIPELPAPPNDLPAYCTADRMFADMPADAKFTNADLHNIQRETTPHGAPWIPATIGRGRRNTVLTLGGLLARARHKETLAAAAAETAWERLTFDSMEAAAARTGIPKPFLQSAKTAGCPAFEGSRIRLAALVRWIFSQGADGPVTDWTKHSEKFKALNEEVKYRQSVDEFVLKSEITGLVQELSAIYTGALKRLRLEGPREFEMRDKAHLKHALEAKVSAVLQQAESKLNQLKAPPPVQTEIATVDK